MPLERLISKVRAQVLSLWNCSSSCIKVSLDHREVASYRRKSAFLLLQPGEQQKCFLKVLLLLFIVCCVIVASLGKMLIFKNGSRALIRFSQVWVAETSLFIATTCCYFINIYIFFFHYPNISYSLLNSSSWETQPEKNTYKAYKKNWFLILNVERGPQF